LRAWVIYSLQNSEVNQILLDMERHDHTKRRKRIRIWFFLKKKNRSCLEFEPRKKEKKNRSDKCKKEKKIGES
jgi:hypothetical protein